MIPGDSRSLLLREAERQATDDRRPTTDDRRPTTDDRRPTTDDRRPTTDDRRPTTDDRRPTTAAMPPPARFAAVQHTEGRFRVGRSAAAPEFAATRRPLREAKRQPLTEDCEVRPRDCVPMHGRVRACSESTGQQTATTAVGLELGSDDGLDGTIGFDGTRSRGVGHRDDSFSSATARSALSQWRPSATSRGCGASRNRASRRSDRRSASASPSSPRDPRNRDCRMPSSGAKRTEAGVSNGIDYRTLRSANSGAWRRRSDRLISRTLGSRGEEAVGASVCTLIGLPPRVGARGRIRREAVVLRVAEILGESAEFA